MLRNYLTIDNNLIVTPPIHNKMTQRKHQVNKTYKIKSKNNVIAGISTKSLPKRMHKRLGFKSSGFLHINKSQNAEKEVAE